jgi:malonate transporter and related proteins
MTGQGPARLPGVSTVVLLKLVGIFAIIAVGYLAGRTKLLGPEAAGVLTTVAFSVFTPALLFRTMAGISVATLPWTTLAAYYGPTLALFFAGYLWQRLRRPSIVVAPSVRAVALTFSNAVQLGVPLMAAIFGTAGLTVHIAIVSLQALVLLTTGTVLAEIDLARAGGTGSEDGTRGSLASVIGQTARRSLIHPVVLPIVAGLVFNATGLAIPVVVDDILVTLGQAVVPVSLVTIGLTLQVHGVAGVLRPAIGVAATKLLLQPALVFAVAYFGFGLRGLPLIVATMFAALPVGVNAFLFADRYDALRAETTAAIVVSTSAFVITGTAWLLLLTHLTG